jgi:hypothetical protein
MSAQIKIVPKDQRLRVTAKFKTETLQFGGNVFEFIEYLQREQVTGKATVSFNAGREYGMTFDFREKDIDTAKS